jgi:hypothetical protein
MTHAPAFAAPVASPSQLAHATCAFDQIAGPRVCSQVQDQIPAIVIGQQLAGSLLVFGQFGNGQHA